MARDRVDRQKRCFFIGELRRSDETLFNEDSWIVKEVIRPEVEAPPFNYKLVPDTVILNRVFSKIERFREDHDRNFPETGENIGESHWLLNEISNADLVIADLTGSAIDAITGVAIARALGQPAILFARNIDTVPIGLRHLPIVFLLENEESSSNLRRLLATQLHFVERMPKVLKTKIDDGLTYSEVGGNLDQPKRDELPSGPDVVERESPFALHDVETANREVERDFHRRIDLIRRRSHQAFRELEREFSKALIELEKTEAAPDEIGIGHNRPPAQYRDYLEEISQTTEELAKSNPSPRRLKKARPRIRELLKLFLDNAAASAGKGVGVAIWTALTALTAKALGYLDALIQILS